MILSSHSAFTIVNKFDSIYNTNRREPLTSTKKPEGNWCYNTFIRIIRKESGMKETVLGVAK